MSYASEFMEPIVWKDFGFSVLWGIVETLFLQLILAPFRLYSPGGTLFQFGACDLITFKYSVFLRFSFSLE